MAVTNFCALDLGFVASEVQELSQKICPPSKQSSGP